MFSRLSCSRPDLASGRVAHSVLGFGLSSGRGCTFAIRLRGRVAERVLLGRTELG
jgi:hypothetical protein